LAESRDVVAKSVPPPAQVRLARRRRYRARPRGRPSARSDTERRLCQRTGRADAGRAGGHTWPFRPRAAAATPSRSAWGWRRGGRRARAGPGRRPGPGRASSSVPRAAARAGFRRRAGAGTASRTRQTGALPARSSSTVRPARRTAPP